MTIYHLKCQECDVEVVEVDLPFERLDNEQLELINQGKPFNYFNPKTGKEREIYRDYREVCGECGSDQP